MKDSESSSDSVMEEIGKKKKRQRKEVMDVWVMFTKSCDCYRMTPVTTVVSDVTVLKNVNEEERRPIIVHILDPSCYTIIISCYNNGISSL